MKTRDNVPWPADCTKPLYCVFNDMGVPGVHNLGPSNKAINVQGCYGKEINARREAIRMCLCRARTLMQDITPPSPDDIADIERIILGLRGNI